jgi:colanic acid/amylovoran biosynthesis glycosyltransferase
MIAENNELIVAHSVGSWLPLTEIWIYKQIEWQKNYRNIILANELSGEHPPFDSLYVSERAAAISRLANRIYRRITRRDLIKDSVLSKFPTVLLHSHFGPTGWADLHLMHKRRHITRFYGFDIDKLPNSFPVWEERYKKLFENCDAFLTEGPFMKESLVRRGCAEEKIFIHPLGTDVAQIPFKQRQYDGYLRVLMACRFTEKKGLIYALEGISKAYHDLNCKAMLVTIVGDSIGVPNEELYKAKMLDIVEKNKIGHIVTLAGNMPYDDLMKISLDHNVFLHPSITASDGDCEGGYPVVLLDMMASGMPVVATVHCDIPFVVPDGRYGVLCREKNSDDIAKALSNIMSGDIEFDSHIISDYVKDKFNWNIRGEALAKIYGQVMR